MKLTFKLEEHVGHTIIPIFENTILHHNSDEIYIKKTTAKQKSKKMIQIMSTKITFYNFALHDKRSR